MVICKHSKGNVKLTYDNYQTKDLDRLIRKRRLKICMCNSLIDDIFIIGIENGNYVDPKN